MGIYRKTKWAIKKTRETNIVKGIFNNPHMNHILFSTFFDPTQLAQPF